MALKLITPSSIPTAAKRRCLSFPDSVEWRAIVNGLVGNAIDAVDWQQINGITPEEAAERCLQMFNEFVNSEGCGTEMFYGAIVLDITNGAKDGWLECNGALFGVNMYPGLFSVIGRSFTEPEIHQDLFRVPNMIDFSPMGAGSSIPIAGTAGEFYHTLSTPEIPQHNHPGVVVSGSQTPARAVVSSGGAQAVVMSGNTGSAGEGLPHNNLHPVIGVRYLIYAGEPL